MHDTEQEAWCAVQPEAQSLFFAFAGILRRQRGPRAYAKHRFASDDCCQTLRRVAEFAGQLEISSPIEHPRLGLTITVVAFIQPCVRLGSERRDCR